MTQRELAEGMSRVEFHRVRDVPGMVEWAYCVGDTVLLKYVFTPVMMREGGRLFRRRGMSNDALYNFSEALKNHPDRFFISDGWVVDLPSDVVDAVNACLDDVIAEKKRMDEVNQALGFGGRE